MQTKKLRSGYTTGVHTSYAFKSALSTFIACNTTSVSKTNKMDNDDLDVTKGCEIIVSVSSSLDELELNTISHEPYVFNSNNNNTKLNIYASSGVGIVTKAGLKPPVGFCAINPVPLKALQDVFESLSSKLLYDEIFCTVGVTNGLEIAKQTANAKVGVLGGISILGTKGIVKPISATAYIDSIEQELNYTKANGFKTIIFTLGNIALKVANEYINSLDENKQNEFYIIEIGNFIYDSISLALNKEIYNIELYIGIAKSVKVALGFKNTHNRFGSIDMSVVALWGDYDIKDCITIKALRDKIEDKNSFDNIVIEKTKDQLKDWFDKEIGLRIC